MTAVIDDPLIAGMVIRRVLPLHESSRRLRALYPECPRVYGVAVMSDVSKRRWWPLAVRADQRAARCDVRRRRRGDGQPGGRRPAVGRHAGPHRHRPGRRAGRARGPGLGHRPGEPLGARRLRGRHRLARRRRPDTAGAARRSVRRAQARGGRAWWNCPARRRSRPGWRTAATASLAPLFDRLHAGQRRRGQRGVDVAHRRVRPSSWRPPRYHCWPARARSSACAAGRRCSTRWSDSGCRCAASSTRADGAGIQFGRIAGKVLRN